MRSFSAMILVMAAVVNTRTATAQQGERTDLPAPRSLDHVLARARPGQHLMVSERTIGRVEGTFFSRSDSTLGILSNRTERFIAFNSIDSVWTRSNAPRTSVLVGALIGGVAFSYLIGGMSNAYEPELSGGSGAYVTGFAIGLLPGILAGGLVATQMPRWTLKFP